MSKTAPRLDWVTRHGVTCSEALGHRAFVIRLYDVPYRYRLLISDDRDPAFPSGRIVADRYYQTVGGAKSFVRRYLQSVPASAEALSREDR